MNPGKPSKPRHALKVAAVAEMLERARHEGLTPDLRPGVYVHAVLQWVANRRLYRPGDPAHEGRRGAKVTPARSAIPLRYHPLLNWYEREYAPQCGSRPEADPLLALLGSRRELWADEPADPYVRRLREGWE